MKKIALPGTFTNTGKGLTHSGEKLEGFAVASADQQFYWADAAIDVIV